MSVWKEIFGNLDDAALTNLKNELATLGHFLF